MPDHFSSRFPFSDTHPGGIALGASYRRPGPLCAATMALANGRQQDRELENQLSWILFRINAPGQEDRLPDMLAQLLGASSFTAGALAGFGRSQASAGIYDMTRVITLLALAEMHESRNSPAFWRRLAPRMSGSALSAMAFAGIPAAMARDAQAAFDERKILLALVEACFEAGPGQGPIQLDAEVARKYSLFKRYKNQPGLAGEHQFGRWFGELLMALLGTKDFTRCLGVGDILQRVAGLQRLLLRLEKKLPLAKPAAPESASLTAAKKAPRPVVIDPADVPPLPLPSGKAKKDDYCAPCAAAAAALTAYPVDSINGCKVLLSADELDFNLPAALPFPWQRSYCSDNPTVGWLGQGWSLPISLALEFSRHHVTLLDEQHRGITFPHLKIGEAFYSRHEQITLKRIDLFDFELTDKTRLRHSFHLPGPAAKQAYLTRRQDPNGNRIRIEYNDQHQPVRIIDAKGRNFALAFDARARLTGIGEVVDANAAPTPLMHYQYDQAGDLVRVLNGANVVTREFAYKNHILVKHAVPDGLVSEYEYHEYFPSGRVMHNRTNTGVALKMAYVKGKTLITDALGRGTTHHFDEDNRYTGSVNALGQRQNLVRDSYGNVIVFTDHNGHTERYQYDGRSRLTRIDAADGGVTQIRYDDACDKPAKVTDPQGGITQYQYDKFGNLLKQTDPLGRSTEYRYNAQGLVSQIIDARGGSKQFEYNDNGQLSASTDCSGRITRREYTWQGHLWREIDPLGNVTEYDYDNHGRKIATWHPDGSSEQVDYDSLGRVIGEENGNGEITRFEYDPEGRLLKRHNAAGGTLEYRYDAGQRLAQLVNENGAVHGFEYDFADRLVQETGFDQRTTHYRYDAMGRLIGKTECGANGEQKDQIETTHERDKLGRLIGKQVTRDGQTASTRFAWDALGRMVEAANDCATVRMAFDAGGQLIAEECELASGPVSRLQHAYDALGNRIQTILPDGRTLNWLYYGSGHLHQINLDGDVITDIERDEAHREIKRSQGVLSSAYEYDPMGRLIGQVARQMASPSAGPQLPDGSMGTNAQTLPLAIARAYDYDDAGNLLAIYDARRGSSEYQYDPIGRILIASQTTPDEVTVDEAFSFDAAHNLLDQVNPVLDQSGESCNTALETNRLTHYQDKFWAFDAHGNVISKSIGQEVQMRLVWDSEHQLVHAIVKRQGVPDISNTEYGYDPFGRRLFKRDEQGQTRFVWDGNRLLAEVREGHNITWIYEDDSFVPMAQVHTSEDTGANAIEILHIHTDHLGTPRELSDASGKLRWAARHRAWGALLAEVMPDAAPNTLPQANQTLRFQGQYFDVETGLHYNRFRYYDPDVGRFVSQDPIGLAGGENLYQYAPNPTGWVDPLGLWPVSSLRVCISGVIGGLVPIVGGAILGIGSNLIASQMFPVIVGAAFVGGAVGYFMDGERPYRFGDNVQGVYTNWTENEATNMDVRSRGGIEMRARQFRGAPYITGAGASDSYRGFVPATVGDEDHSVIAGDLLRNTGQGIKTDKQKQHAAMMEAVVGLAEEWRKHGAAWVFRAILRGVEAGRWKMDQIYTLFAFVKSANSGRRQVARLQDVRAGRLPSFALVGEEREIAEYGSDIDDSGFESDDEVRARHGMKGRRLFSKKYDK